MLKKKPVILIVDNEIEICNLFRDFVDFMGYDSLIETDGEKILRDIDSINYDIMFVDLKLGSVSGVDILKKSKTVHPDSEVIIVTGYGTEETVLKAIHFGSMSYIQKPISFSEIKEHIEEALAKRRFNIQTTTLRNTIQSCAPSLVTHFDDILNLDRLTTYLSHTIDIETLADLIMNGVADIIPLPGYYGSFFFFDDVNREMVIFSKDPLHAKTASLIEDQIKAFYENLVGRELDSLYNVKVMIPSVKTGVMESEQQRIYSFFIPLLVNNSVKGVMGLSGKSESLSEHTKDIMRLISFRINNILSNATVHRDTKMLALTDGLTGLLNHRAFHERLNQEFERFSRYGSFLSLLVADFDDLKAYNDSYGHPVGDEVLRSIGRILRNSTRESDVLARYGGDEFVALLPHANAKNAIDMAERIKQRMKNEVISIHGLQLKGTISIGVATLPDEKMKTPLDFFKSADKALYEAKRCGKDRISVANSF